MGEIQNGAQQHMLLPPKQGIGNLKKELKNYYMSIPYVHASSFRTKKVSPMVDLHTIVY
jgi:hypothetical protein